MYCGDASKAQRKPWPACLQAPTTFGHLLCVLGKNYIFTQSRTRQHILSCSFVEEAEFAMKRSQNALERITEIMTQLQGLFLGALMPHCNL